MNSRLTWSLLGAAFLLAQGCGEPSAGSSELANRQASGSGGGSGMACESDLDCPEGEECELEHGDSFCKPHGGDQNGEDGGMVACESDLDCAEGEECELEHGGSFCEPQDDDNQNCDGSSDDDGHEGADCSDDDSDSDSDDDGNDDSDSDSDSDDDGQGGTDGGQA